MTTKLSIGVDPITGDIKIGRAKEIRPGLHMFTGQTEIVTDRAFQCIVECCHTTKTTEYTGMIYGKKFILTYKEEDDGEKEQKEQEMQE